jgi:hypothetical protein
VAYADSVVVTINGLGSPVGPLLFASESDDDDDDDDDARSVSAELESDGIWLS